MKPAPALLLRPLSNSSSPFTVLIIGSSVSGTIRNSSIRRLTLHPTLDHRTAVFILRSDRRYYLEPEYLVLRHSVLVLPCSIGGVVGAGIMAFGWQSVSWGYFLDPRGSDDLSNPAAQLCGRLAHDESAAASWPSVSSPSCPVFSLCAILVNMVFCGLESLVDDSQKSTGILMILIGICFGTSPEQIPLGQSEGDVAFALALGILTGGLKIIKTVGTGIYRVRPIHSFTSQLSSGLVILGASVIWRTSQRRVRSSAHPLSVWVPLSAIKVSNGTLQVKLLISWIITVPIAGAIGAVLLAVLRLIFL